MSKKEFNKTSKCRFCRMGVDEVDYKDSIYLPKLATSQGSFFPESVLETVPHHQHSVKVSGKGRGLWHYFRMWPGGYNHGIVVKKNVDKLEQNWRRCESKEGVCQKLFDAQRVSNECSPANLKQTEKKDKDGIAIEGR